MTVTANPNSVSLLTGTSTSTLTVSAPSFTPTGIFTMNLTGYSGRLSHLAQAFLLIASPPPRDFAIAANSTSMALSQGSSGTASLTISSVSGFSGMVNLTATISPIIGNGPTAILNPTKVTVTSGGTANSPTVCVDLRINASERLYNICPSDQRDLFPLSVNY